MSTRKWTTLATVLGVATLTLLSTTTPASALERVDCHEGGYFSIMEKGAQGPKMCFKNKGDLDVDIHKVWRVWTGNNAGWFDYRDWEGKNRRENFPKDKDLQYDAYINITYMHVD